MKRTIYLAILFCLCTSVAYAQEHFRFVGHILTEGAQIPFEITIIQEPDGSLTGTSGTWKGSEYEVFTRLVARYDASTNMLSFEETKNMKTNFSELNREFCFVKGAYVVETIDGKSVLQGPYTARKEDRSPCPRGTLKLTSDKIFDPDKKTQPKTPSVSGIETTLPPTPTPKPPLRPEPKPEIADKPQLRLDTVREGFLTTDNVYTYRTSSSSLRLQWGDFSNLDGDSITVSVNGKDVVNNLRLTSNMINQSLPLHAGETDTIRVRMLNEGRVSPNTSLLNFFDEEKMKYYNFKINGKKDEELILLIMRED